MRWSNLKLKDAQLKKLKTSVKDNAGAMICLMNCYWQQDKKQN